MFCYVVFTAQQALEQLQSTAQEHVPLAVERYSPTGTQNNVSVLSVTFSQPMIELATVDQIAEVTKGEPLVVSCFSITL
jgi:hypothetical protein